MQHVSIASSKQILRHFNRPASQVVFLLFASFIVGSEAYAQLPAGTQDTTQSSPQPDDVRTQANAALDLQDYPRALKLLQTLADRNPKDPHILYDLAYTEDALDQMTTAAAAYRAAIAADPTLVEAHLGLGLLLARTAQPSDARTELASAASLPTGSPALRARAYRALARLDLKSNPDASRDELLAALKLSPETPEDTLLAAELAESAKDPAAAEQSYRRSLGKTPNDPAATAALAHLLTLTKPDEAEALLTAALAAHTGDATLTTQLAALYATQNKFAQAIPLAETLHTANPQDSNITRLLAHLYAQGGAPGKADPLFASLLRANPDPALMDDRADALIKLRRFPEAETILKQAVARPDAFPTREDFGIAASHLAFAASNNNDPAETLRALDLRATVLPPSPSAMFLAAAAQDKLHNFKQATELYKQFLAAAAGKFPDEEFEARHRLLALSKRN